MKINYLIIDDEPIAHTLIEKYCKELPFMHLMGNCYHALEAIPLLKTQPIDLVFLDIKMPRVTGFDFLKSLSQPPHVIVVSAHKEYALEGYEYNITDYLLKPFSFERFLKSVQKVVDALSDSEIPVNQPDRSIFIKDEKKHHRVGLHEIVYIEAKGNYCLVVLSSSNIITPMKISDFERLLPAEEFFRVHRSFIVSKHFVSLVKASEIHLGEKVIPVGRVYKPNIERILIN
ncbi:LytTR family DNA-binding domain-containing protein [Rapidithrix thailandica]|uniref:LytTR family DNA-binding domain-containing protein n=1 Tax=Rapidithrix thailandica TaxID=413964 RepID=A0AAW9SGC6_9BACT